MGSLKSVGKPIELILLRPIDQSIGRLVLLSLLHLVLSVVVSPSQSRSDKLIFLCSTGSLANFR